MQISHNGKKVIVTVVVIVALCVLAVASNMYISDGNEKLAKANGKNQELTKQVTELNTQLSDKSAELEKKTAENAALTAKVNEQNATIAQQKAQIANLQAQLDKAKKSAKNNAAKAPVINAPSIPASGNKVCYLTFDDGPSASTPRLLSQLQSAGVKATFFVVSNAYLDDYLDDIYNAGHAVGLHCNSHAWGSVYASPDAFFADLSAIEQKVFGYIGLHSRITRFPGGSSNTVSRKYSPGIMSTVTSQMTQRGYCYFDWNVDSGDASGKKYTAAQIANNVVRGASGKSSVCVLMHDAISKKSTVEAIPSMVYQLRNLGFTFQTLNMSSPDFHQRVNN